MSNQKTYLILSALGEDKPGIVNILTKAILEHGGNIIDSRMTVLGGEFAALLMLEGPWNALAKIEGAVPELEKELAMTIIVKRTGERATESNHLPYAVEVVAMDNPGIVNNLAGFFSERNINIEDLVTNSYAAAHTGTPMFAVQMTVGIPADVQLSGLREEFMDYCDSLNLDAVLEPVKN